MAARVLRATLVIAALWLIGAATGQPVQPEMVAFNRQYGFAAGATGGSGKPPVTLTELGVDGGQLRDILDGTDATCSANDGCVVDFGGLEGEILITSNLLIKQDNVTIDGRTAGPDGVGITAGCGLRFADVRNQIWRYMRVSGPNRETAGEPDAITFLLDTTTAEVSQILLDHMTVRWGWDEVLSFNTIHGGSIHDITVQNSVIAQGWIGTGETASKCTLVGGDTNNLSFIGNIFTGCAERNPLLSFGYSLGARGNPITSWRNVEIVGNIIHNYAEPISIQLLSNENKLRLDMVDNSFVDGDPSTPSAGPYSGVSERRGIVLRGANEGEVSLYMHGNTATDAVYGTRGRDIDPRGCDLLMEGSTSESCASTHLSSANSVAAGVPFNLSSTPHFSRPYHITSRDVGELALHGAIGAGTTAPGRDTWDTNIISNVINTPTSATLPETTGAPPNVKVTEVGNTSTVSTLTFTAVTGAADPATQQFDIYNDGIDTVNWTVTATDGTTPDWLSVDCTTGDTPAAGRDTCTVTVDNTPGGAGLAVGAYDGLITVQPQSAQGQNFGYPRGIVVTHTVTPSGGTNSVPQIASAAFSAGSCVVADTCDDVTLTATCVMGTCVDGTITWTYDSDNNGSYETTLGTGTSLSAVAVPDTGSLASVGLASMKLKVADGDADNDTQDLSIRVDSQTLAAQMTLTPATGTAPLNDIDVTIDLSGNCPDIGAGSGVDVTNTSCGAGCTASAGFTAGATNSTDDPIVFTDACDCPSAGQQTISADVGGCASAPDVTGVQAVASVQSGTTFGLSIEPIGTNGLTLSSCDEPCSLYDVVFHYSGNWSDASGIQYVTDIQCDVDDPSGYDAPSIATEHCYQPTGVDPFYEEIDCIGGSWRGDGGFTGYTYATDGRYTVKCTATAGGVTQTATAPITVNNVATSVGDLESDVNTLTYNYDFGATPPTRTFYLSSINATDVAFTVAETNSGGTVASDFPWLSCTPLTGTAPAPGTTPQAVVCTVSTGLAVGTYTGYVTASNDDAAGDIEVITVSVTVNDVQTDACTDGVDCRCDRLTKSTGDLYNSDVVWCEDFEAVTLYEPQVTKGDHFNSAGENIYGDWMDDTASPYESGRAFCGTDSYWTRMYGRGQASEVISGSNCTTAPSSVGDDRNTCEYDPNNKWNITSTSSGDYRACCVDIQREGDANIAADDTARVNPDVFDGRQIYAARLVKDSIATPSCGFAGFVDGTGGAGDVTPRASLNKAGTDQTTWGFTAALAWSDNYLQTIFGDNPNNSSGIKSDEWNGNFARWPFGTYDARRTGLAYFPFGGPIFYSSSYISQNTCGPNGVGQPYFPSETCSVCASGLNAVATTGTFYCTDVFMGYRPSGYSQATNWPLGTWGCVRGYMQGWGTTSAHLTAWFMPKGGTSETKVFEGTWDSTKTHGTDASMASFGFDHWVPRSSGALPQYIDENIYRYQDNMVVTRGGPPVSCSDIGF